MTKPLGKILGSVSMPFKLGKALLGKKKKTATAVDAPAVAAVEPAKNVAPTPDDELMRRQRERDAMRRYKSGRTSTILSDGSGTLG